MPLSRRASIVPLALAGDGQTFFASVFTKRFSGVARIDARTGTFARIKGFPNATNDQAGASFDGRWLVWHEYHSLNGLDDFTTWSWDSETGQVRQVGGATRSPGGSFWPSPWRDPDARAGFATWTQGSGDAGIADVHVVDLASGSNRIVRHGHPAGSFLLNDGLVVWPESVVQGAQTKMLAAEVSSGQDVPAPVGLRDVRGVGWVATDGKGVLYPRGTNLTSLWWSPSSATPPRHVFITRLDAAQGYPIDVPVAVSGRFVSFRAEPHDYLVDTVKGRYVEIPGGGWGVLDKKSFVYLPSSPKKANHLVSPVLFYRLSELPPIPPCR